MTEEYLQKEAGFTFLDDKAHGLVAMYCPMPGVTAEMIRWWFWWHPQENQRYQIWYPSEHYTNTYPKKDRNYFEQSNIPHYTPNYTNYAKERVGNFKATFQLDFKQAEEAGFSSQLMKENHIPLILSARVGMKHLFAHTEMVHIFKETEDGLFMFSRFWMGEALNNDFLRKQLISENVLKGMAEHCCIEYRNLAEILPDLYETYGKKK